MDILSIKNGVALALSLLLGMAAWKVNAKPSYSVAPTLANDTCEFNPEWITSPTLPTEVPETTLPDGSKDSTFCDFYKFSWQTFFYLVSPDGNVGNNLNSYPVRFENQTDFPLLLTEGNSCAETSQNRKHAFFLRTAKSTDAHSTMTAAGAPERIGQAGGGSVIYDQNGNAAFYEVRFSRNMCKLADKHGILRRQYFPAGTTELKMAWKVLKIGAKVYDNNENNYFTITTPIDGVENGKPITLGMIGFHIAIATKAHPEMIWITFEQNKNSPFCTEAGQEQTGWSFASKECTKALTSSAEEETWLQNSNCNFNNPTVTAQNADKLIDTDNHTNICQVYRNGTLSVQQKEQNDEPIDELYKGLQNVEIKDSDKWAKVWQKNYRMIGALWLSQPDDKPNTFSPSNPVFKQRGSIALANPVMETDFMYMPLKNCFTCHGFYPEGLKEPANDDFVEVTSTSNVLSHILDDIMRQKEWCTLTDSDDKPATVYSDYSVHPLGLEDQEYLFYECNDACISYTKPKSLKWNGNYKTNGQEIHCQCC
ncbi:MAG: hypothetical protein ACR2PT_09600 [Endozoicomonas sp.]